MNASSPYCPLQRHLSLLGQLEPRGAFSVWVGALQGPPVFVHDEDRFHYAASTMKLPLVMAAYREADRGRLDLDSAVLLRNRFASATGNEPFTMDPDEDNDQAPWRRLGSEVSVRWLALRAIVASSNLATNALLEVVGLPAVAELVADAGAAKLQVLRGIEDWAARAAGLENVVTAADLALLLQVLWAGELLSADSNTEVMSVLAAQQVNDAIPARLPAGTLVAHKSGWIEGISHDAGVVHPTGSEPFIFAMCTTSALTATEALEAIAVAAELTWSGWVGAE